MALGAPSRLLFLVRPRIGADDATSADITANAAVVARRGRAP
jgi:hypothetical protein